MDLFRKHYINENNRGKMYIIYTIGLNVTVLIDISSFSSFLQNFSDDNMTTSKYLLVPHSHPLTSIPTVISGNNCNNGHNLNHRESLTADTETERSTTSLIHCDNMFVSDGVHGSVNSDKSWYHHPHPNSGDGNHQCAIKGSNSVAIHNGKRLQVRLQEDVERDSANAEEDSPALFTCYLLLGMTSFVTFWVMLMLRIYLPERYWTWSYIWWSWAGCLLCQNYILNKLILNDC